MATQTDKVVVESIWKLQDHASGPAKSMANHFNLLGNQIRMTNDHLRVTQTLMGTAAFAGAAYGSFRLAKSVVSANLELEKMKYGIGAILLQSQKLGYIPGNKYKDMNDSLKEAEGVYQRLYVYAQKAVGTADDYTSAWRDIAMSVSKAGGGIADIERVAQLIVPLSKQLGLIPENAFRDVQQYLTGRMTVRDVVPRMIGLGNDPNYAKMTDSERLSKLIAALETGREGAKAYENSFEAQLDTFKSLFVQMQREGGKGLFEQVKQDMIQFNQNFLSNEKKIYDYAKKITHEFTGMYTSIKNGAIWVAENFDHIVTTSKVMLEIFVAMKMAAMMAAGVNGMGNFLAGFASFKALGGFAAAGTAAFATQLGLVAPIAFIASLGILELVRAIRKFNAETEAGKKAGQAVDKRVDVAYQLVESHQRQMAELKDEFSGAGSAKGNMAAEALRRGTFTSHEWATMDLAAIKEAKAIQAQNPYLTTLENGGQGISGSHKNYKSLSAKDYNNLYYLAMEKQIKLRTGFDPNVMGEAPAKVNVANDFRGSRINITVDSRHADPNRVAATVISALGRAAKSRTGSNMGLAGSVA